MGIELYSVDNFFNYDKSTENDLSFSEIWCSSRKEKCLEWIGNHNFTKICLQFPDNYLNFSTGIIQDLENKLNNVKFYVIADTAYSNCCLDEISAAHIDGDSIIHFGNKCPGNNKSSARIPVLHIFPSFKFSFKKLIQSLSQYKEEFIGKTINVLLDNGYHHVINQFLDYSSVSSEFCFKPILYPFDKGIIETETCFGNGPCLFIGQDDDQFFNLTISVDSSQKLFIYKPNIDTFFESDSLESKVFRRRYFHIEKCKDAQTIGIIVATLTSEGYLDAVKRIQDMSRSLGIRTEIISVGRINPEKLANFFQVDCFVLVGCPFNRFYSQKNFLKPIVSVFEAELALNPVRHTLYTRKYITDFKKILPRGSSFMEFDLENNSENDLSLISGCIRASDHLINSSIEKKCAKNETKILKLEIDSSLINREWKGLEQNLNEAEPSTLQMGLFGIPVQYRQK